MSRCEEEIKSGYKEALLQAGRKMLHSGLTVETWGNLSVRDPETGLIYLTPSAMPYDTLTEGDIVVVRVDGTIVQGTRKPTVEEGMHRDIYGARPDVQAIIHTHPMHSMVFAVLHQPIPPILDEAAQTLGGTVSVAPYALPGTQQLAENVQKALGKEGTACLLANHGAVCVGANLDQAFKVCTVLEMTVQVYQQALTIGRPCSISAEDVSYMRDFMLYHYGQNK